MLINYYVKQFYWILCEINTLLNTEIMLAYFRVLIEDELVAKLRKKEKLANHQPRYLVAIAVNFVRLRSRYNFDAKTLLSCTRRDWLHSHRTLRPVADLCPSIDPLIDRFTKKNISKNQCIKTIDKTFIKLNIGLSSFHRYFRTLIEINQFTV